MEELLNQQLAWVKGKEVALLKSEPPYHAPEELTNYVQELQVDMSTFLSFSIVFYI